MVQEAFNAAILNLTQGLLDGALCNPSGLRGLSSKTKHSVDRLKRACHAVTHVPCFLCGARFEKELKQVLTKIHTCFYSLDLGTF